MKNSQISEIIIIIIIIGRRRLKSTAVCRQSGVRKETIHNMISKFSKLTQKASKKQTHLDGEGDSLGTVQTTEFHPYR